MKGWIKVHEGGGEIAVPVRAIQTVQKSEHSRFHGFIQTNAVGNIYFEETYEEVLALIEEAEGEDKGEKKKSLFGLLCSVQEECCKHEHCGDCALYVDFCPWETFLHGECPDDLNLDMIPEEYR